VTRFAVGLFGFLFLFAFVGFMADEQVSTGYAAGSALIAATLLTAQTVLLVWLARAIWRALRRRAADHIADQQTVAQTADQLTGAIRQRRYYPVSERDETNAATPGNWAQH